MAAGVEDEVVAVALTPGLGHAEAETGGFVEESGLGDLAATLGGQGTTNIGGEGRLSGGAGWVEHFGAGVSSSECSTIFPLDSSPKTESAAMGRALMIIFKLCI